MSVQTLEQTRLGAYPENRLAAYLLLTSDYLSKPFFALCESCRWIPAIDTLYSSENLLFRSARKVALVFQMVVFSLATLVCLLPAFFLRGVGNSLFGHAFLYAPGATSEKFLDENQPLFSLLSWNVCCIPGFSFQSGVMPYPLRIERIAQRIIQESCDVVCLYEVFDNIAAGQIRKALAASGYAHFYFNIGPKTLGLNSGLFVASKFAVQNPQFTPFKNSSQIQRGVFSFDLMSAQSRFARIFATHLHSSQESTAPKAEEIAIRQEQMECILEGLPKEKICTVIAGDLNLDDEELENSSWNACFEQGEIRGGKSWGAYSDGLNLDHVMVVKTTALIQTAVKEVGFNPNQLREEALSDHAILCTQLRAPQLLSP
jgi:endonuclease/exonuclease/phosphatase family metal-dependent hydrolase